MALAFLQVGYNVVFPDGQGVLSHNEVGYWRGGLFYFQAGHPALPMTSRGVGGSADGVAPYLRLSTTRAPT